MRVFVLVSSFLFFGCYGPTPAPGAPCSESGGCPDGQSCDIGAGVCQAVASLSCSEPAARCGDECVAILSDTLNCGECGNECGPRMACRDGACDEADSVVDCEDGLHNGNESDVDCGGGCEPCPTGDSCVDSTDCTSALCDSGVCKACGEDAACPEGTFCTASGRCEAIAQQGESCESDESCATGFCVDGVCCDSSCENACEQCNAEGQCEAVPAGQDSGGDCAQDGACGQTGRCDGERGCEIVSAGTTCPLESCAGGAAAQGLCDGLGTCTAAPGASCDPYICGPADSCLLTCLGDSDCASGHYCSGGSCVPTKQNGESCSLANECVSGSCADGVCCNNDCSGTCQSCNISGSVGTCSAYAANTDPEAECSAQGASTCGRTGMCSGGSSCKLYPAGTSCGGAGCSGSTLYQSGTCNGVGTCVRPSHSCAPYSCDGGQCGMQCGPVNTNQGCHPAYYCRTLVGGVTHCSPDGGTGAFCTSDAMCLSGTCTTVNVFSGQCQ